MKTHEIMKYYLLFIAAITALVIILASTAPHSKTGKRLTEQSNIIAKPIKAIEIPANDLIESKYHLINDTIHVLSALSYFTLSYNYNGVIVYVDVVIEGDMIKFSSIRIE